MKDINELCDRVRQIGYNVHGGAILGYLKATRLEHGLLVNFGSYIPQVCLD